MAHIPGLPLIRTGTDRSGRWLDGVQECLLQCHSVPTTQENTLRCKWQCHCYRDNLESTLSVKQILHILEDFAKICQILNTQPILTNHTLELLTHLIQSLHMEQSEFSLSKLRAHFDIR